MRKITKKASMQDIGYIMGFIFMISIVILITFKVSDTLNTKFQDSSQITTEGKTAFGRINNLFPNVLDNSFMLLVIGLGIVAIALASMVRVHPVFFIFFLLILIIIIFLSAAFSNTYQAIGSNENFVDLADQLVYTSYVMHFLPFIIGVFGFIISFVMYKSLQNG
ncbi:hypothetical protein KKC13_13710 [bacterium]|nr:hypothetical protein [bacterium]